MWVSQRSLPRPAPKHLDVRPRLSPLGIDADDLMEVIGHDRIGGDIDRENPGQLLHLRHDPAAPLLEISPGRQILATKKRPAHTTGDHVLPGGGLQAD